MQERGRRSIKEERKDLNSARPSNRISNHLPEAQDVVDAVDQFLNLPQGERHSGYHKRGKKRSSTYQKRSSNNTKNRQSRRANPRTMSYVVEEKKLPANFAENILELELKIDQGTFSMDTISQLMELYQQAVEYYDGINDGKNAIY